MTWFVVVGALIIFFGFATFFGAPYVPSRKRFITRAFEKLYTVTARDLVVDVGSGDGIVLRMAAQKGARAVGYEINPLLVLISKLVSANNPNITVHLANFWLVELPAETTIVYAFAVSRDGKKLIAKMQHEANRLQKTLKLMCYASPLPGKKAEATFEAYHLYSFHPLHQSQAQV